MASIGDDIYASLSAAGFTGSLVDKLKKFWNVTAEKGLSLGKALTVTASSAVAVPLTGTTTETTLATITIPAGTIGPNGTVRVTANWSLTNNANNKTLRVKLGSTTLVSTVFTTVALAAHRMLITNRNSESSQHVSVDRSRGTDTVSTFEFATSAVDTTVAQNITLTAQLAVGTDTATLESYIVEVVNGA